MGILMPLNSSVKMLGALKRIGVDVATFANLRETPEMPVRLESVRAIPVARENTLSQGKIRNVQAIENRLGELDSLMGVAIKKERKAFEARRKVGVARRSRIAAFVPEGCFNSAPTGNGTQR